MITDLLKYLNVESDPNILYDDLINTRKTRKKLKDTYYEKHHIIPRCLGGKDEDDNYVYLTPEEHIIAHILLFRKYPENKKIIRAVDCMFSLVSPSTKERYNVINDPDLITIKSEARKAASESKKLRVVCFKYTESTDIEIFRIFDCLGDAKELGFKISSSGVKKISESGGFYWGYYDNIEEKYPEAIQYFIENNITTEISPEVIREHYSRYSGEFLIWKDDHRVIRIYQKLSDVIEDGFTESGASRALNYPDKTNGGFYKDYYWEYSDFFKKDYLKEYNDFNSSIKEPIAFYGTQIVCYTEDYEIVRIYKSLTDTEKDGFKKPYLCRILKSEKKYCNGYYWEYLKNWKYLEKVEEYKSLKSLPELNKTKSGYEKIRILRCDDNNDIIDIFPNLHAVPGISFKSLSKILSQDNKNRNYKGFNWYRVSEYLELFPTKAKESENYIEFIEPEKPKELRILLTISSKLISVNELYKARVAYTSGGRAYPVLYKNPKAQKVSDEVRNQLLYLDLSSYIPWLKRTKKYSISINFILKTGITRRDCANFEKIMCDDLTRFIKNDLGVEHFDDSEFYECNFVKSICPNAKNEYAYIILKESFFEDRVDIVDKPVRAFMSGSFMSTFNWRKELENLYNSDPNPTISFYNPLNNLWDSEIRTIEKYQKCNTDLYVITPGDLTESLEVEIINRVDNIIMTGENIFIFIGVLGELELYSEEELERIEFISDFTSNKSKIDFKILENVKQIYNWIKNE